MIKWTVSVLLLLWVGWHWARPVDLTIADLGRHIKNGELITHGVWDVLYKNYYSYTCPNYPVINHHWLFGVVAFILWHTFGFSGLALVYSALGVLTFYLFFRLAQTFSSWKTACVFGLLALPLMACRVEPRPEGISMLFCGLVWQILTCWRQQRLRPRHFIVLLVVLQILWVNTHIYFVMGPLLIVLSWLQAKLNGYQEQAGVLKTAFWLTAASCLVNPSGIEGALLPLEFIKDLSYKVAEQQSVWFMLTHDFNPVYPYFLLSAVFAGFAWLFVMNQEGFRKNVLMLSIGTLFFLGAAKSVRLIAPYGFFWLPVSCYAWERWMRARPAAWQKVLLTVLAAAGIIASSMFNFSWRKPPVVGLTQGVNEPMRFFKEENIQGPIFNNYDIGGYLIFHLSPSYKFFVDDRAEAFPPEFFKNIYIPMLVNDGAWQAVDGLYHFNVIFFNRKDKTSWGHRFIVKRLADASWAPVFVDENTILFLRRTARNEPVIARFQFHLVKINSSIYGEGYRLDR